VGRGFWVMDSSIGWGVTGRRNSGACDDVFLNDGNGFGIHFNAEVAARDITPSETQNTFQIFNGFGLFKLGD